MIALGAQSDLYDASYQSDYRTYQSRFSLESDEEYRNLEEYAVLPDLLSDLRYSPDEGANRLLKNSGMLLFQRMLLNFAKKYAYCAKAEACRKLLLNALGDVEEEQGAAAAELKRTEDRYTAERAKKREELIQKIKEKPDFSRAYTDIVDRAFTKFHGDITPFLGGLLPEVTQQWKRIEGNQWTDKKETAQCHEIMVRLCNEEYQKNANAIRKFYEGEFSALAAAYQNHINSIIESDQQLSAETKERLICIHAPTPIFSPTYAEYKNDKKAFSKVFLFWGEKINPKKYACELRIDFETRCQADCVTAPAKIFNKTLNEWTAALQKIYTSDIDTKSVDLKDFDEKILACKKKVVAVEVILGELSCSKMKLEHLTSFKGGHYNERL